MRNVFGRDRLSGLTKDWLARRLPRGRVIPILALCIVIAISVAIGMLYYQGRLGRLGELEPLLEYAKYYGYPGIFGVSLAFNSTVLIVMPSFWIYFPIGKYLSPYLFPPLVGLAGGAGAAIGELVGYMGGYSGRGIVQRRRLYAKAESWVRRWGAIMIFLFNFVPLFPFDLMGLAAGALRYPLWRFFLICLGGRTLSYTIIACAGAGWIPLPFPL